MTTMMPEPKLFTKVETFRGVEMETIYRQGKVPVDPKDENRDAGGPGMNSMGMGVCPELNPRTYVPCFRACLRANSKASA